MNHLIQSFCTNKSKLYKDIFERRLAFFRRNVKLYVASVKAKINDFHVDNNSVRFKLNTYYEISLSRNTELAKSTYVHFSILQNSTMLFSAIYWFLIPHINN